MQAVILAAGKSTRTYPLTLTRPKPLLKIANKTLLEHNLDNLNNIADEAIIIVGYKKELIKKHLGSRYKNIKIKYAEQKSQLGTGNALLMAEKFVKNEFISLYGDDIYSRKDFENILMSKYSILVKKIDNPGLFGVVLSRKGILTDLVEKPKKFISNLANAGLYKLDRKIFILLSKLKKSKRNEFELTDAIKDLSKAEKIHCISSKSWLPVGYPMDLLKADVALRKNKNFIGSSSKTPGQISNSSIGDGCNILGKVKDSVIMDGAVIGKNSVIERSIIGENSYVDGRISNSVIADNAKLKNVVLKGCKIWPNRMISNKTIEKDVQ